MRCAGIWPRQVNTADYKGLWLCLRSLTYANIRNDCPKILFGICGRRGSCEVCFMKREQTCSSTKPWTTTGSESPAACKNSITRSHVVSPVTGTWKISTVNYVRIIC
eukprot:PhF_6_TR7290/c0_g1_i1/m.10899